MINSPHRFADVGVEMVLHGVVVPSWEHVGDIRPLVAQLVMELEQKSLLVEIPMFLLLILVKFVEAVWLNLSINFELFCIAQIGGDESFR